MLPYHMLCVSKSDLSSELPVVGWYVVFCDDYGEHVCVHCLSQTHAQVFMLAFTNTNQMH